MPNMGGQTIPTFIPNIVGICWAKMLASFGQGLTYNVGPGKLQLESQTLHLKFYDLIRALFRLNSELLVRSRPSLCAVFYILAEAILYLK